MAIDLGPDFPLSPDALRQREAIEDCLVNALYCVRHDPIGGNVRHCVEQALGHMNAPASTASLPQQEDNHA